MAKARVFISFDFDHDSKVKEILAAQAKLEDSPFDFIDASVKEPLSGDWVEKVDRRMNNIDLVIVLCGKYMASAKGVAEELKIAKSKKIPYFLLRAYSELECTKPTNAQVDDKVYPWTWKNIKLLVSGQR